jgi:hypothetical protein
VKRTVREIYFDMKNVTDSFFSYTLNERLRCLHAGIFPFEKSTVEENGFHLNFYLIFKFVFLLQ